MHRHAQIDRGASLTKTVKGSGAHPRFPRPQPVLPGQPTQLRGISSEKKRIFSSSPGLGSAARLATASPPPCMGAEAACTYLGLDKRLHRRRRYQLHLKKIEREGHLFAIQGEAEGRKGWTVLQEKGKLGPGACRWQPSCVDGRLTERKAPLWVFRSTGMRNRGD